MNMTVRPVRRDDRECWIEMRAALWPDADRDELAQEVDAYLAGVGFMLECVLVAFHEGAVRGFVEVSLRPYAEGCSTTPVAYLEAWYVDPARRATGVGRALVAAAEGWAGRRGCREFASDTRVDNAASAAAHDALGFEHVETIHCFRKTL